MPLRIFRRSHAFATAVLPLVVASAVTVTFAACSELKRAEDSPAAASDGGDEGGPVTEDGSVLDGAPGDGATPDAGAPPLDFECPTDPWTTTKKTTKECAPRQVKVLETEAPIEVRGISIAHTPAGRVGVVYNSEPDFDMGELHLVHFTPTLPTYPAPKLVIRATGLGFHDGYNAKIAAMAPDTLQVLTYDTNGVDGEVHLRKLVAGAEPLTDVLVASGVKNPTEIALGSDLAGNTVVTYRVSSSATIGKLSSKKGTAAGIFTALPDLGSTLHTTVAAGIGAGSIFVDPGGQVHLLYQYNDDTISPQASAPRYHTLSGNLWSDRKTIDNTMSSGLSGYSGSIAVFGTKKYAALFFRKLGQVTNPNTADLRLVSWDSQSDVPTVELIDQNIPSPDPLNPTYRVAIAVDKFGLVHLAIIRPTDIDHGFLEYRRQTRVPGGGTKWLSDIVDPDVISQYAAAFVDMVVDDNARPHIAYRSANDDIAQPTSSKIVYATRYDR